MTTTDLYYGQHWNDGEGLVYTDLQDQQDAMLARIYDQIIQGSAGWDASGSVEDWQASLGTLTNGDVPQSLGANGVAYCLQPGGAYPKQGSSGTKVKITPGVIMQKVAATSTGGSPTLLAYNFTGAEEVTINAGATSTRTDVIQCQLSLVDGGALSRDFEDGTTHVVSTQSMNKTRRVQCTLSYKPNSTTVDAGYVLLALVQVGSTWTTGFKYNQSGPPTSADAVILDSRFPLKVRAHTYAPKDIDLSMASGWTLSANGVITAAGTASAATIWVPEGRLGRIIGIGILADWNRSLTSDMSNCSWNHTSHWTFNDTQNLSSIFTGVTNDSVCVIGPSAISTWWTNGWGGAGAEVLSQANNSKIPRRVAIRLGAGASGNEIGAVTVYIAEGM